MGYDDNLKRDFKEFLDGFKNMASDLKDKERRIKQIPNILTLSRLLIAFFIPLTALTGNLGWSAVLTIIAASTDAFDGFAARKLNAISEFGKNLDPVCDKLFSAILIIPLMFKLSPLLSFGLGINFVIEAFIAFTNVKSKAKGHKPKSSWLGKIKTTFLSILLAILYISFSYQFNPLLIPIIYSITTIIELVTYIDYYLSDKKKDLTMKKEKSINSKNIKKKVSNPS